MTLEDSPKQAHSTDSVAGLKAGALSPKMATGLAIAAFIPAVGIATTPAYVASVAGNSTWLALLVASLGTSAVALAVILFARRFVVSGALYSYINHVFGQRASLVTAASVILAYLLGTAFIVVAATIYISSFAGSFGWEPAQSIWFKSMSIVAVCLIACLAALRGIEASAKITVLLMFLTLPLVVLITVALPFNTDLDFSSQLGLDGFSISGVMQGVAIGAAVIILFESSAATAFETENPKKSVPRIVLAVPLGLGLLYTLCAFPQIPALALVPDQLAAGQSPISAMASLSGLGGLDRIVDLSLAIALISSTIAFVNYGARVGATMAADGTLPEPLARVHAKYRTPHVAVIAVSVLIAAATITMLVVNGGDAYQVYNFSASIYTFAVVIPYILVCIGAAVLLRRERSNAFRYFVITGAVGVAVFVWIYVNAVVYPAESPLNWTPYIFVAFLVVLVATLKVTKTKRTQQARTADASDVG